MTDLDTLRGQVRGKCTKKNPSTCRIHGSGYRARQELYFAAKENVERIAFKAKTDPDFEASWDLKKDSNGTITVGVFRSGVPNPPKERGVEKRYYERADHFRPEGRQGRNDGVFASPTLGGVCRWVRGNHMTNIPDVKVRELRVDIDNTYVYSVRSWEIASSTNAEEHYKEYWDSGITMREYMNRARKDPKTYDPTEWELLVPEGSIKSVKPVGAKRVAERSYEVTGGREVRNILNDKPLHYQTKAEREARGY